MLKAAGVPVTYAHIERGTAAAHTGCNGCGNGIIQAGGVLRFGHLTVVRSAPYHNMKRKPLGFLIEDGHEASCSGRSIPQNLGVTADRLTYIAVRCNYEKAC